MVRDGSVHDDLLLRRRKPVVDAGKGHRGLALSGGRSWRSTHPKIASTAVRSSFGAQRVEVPPKGRHAQGLQVINHCLSLLVCCTKEGAGKRTKDSMRRCCCSRDNTARRSDGTTYPTSMLAAETQLIGHETRRYSFFVRGEPTEKPNAGRKCGLLRLSSLTFPVGGTSHGIGGSSSAYFHFVNGRSERTRVRAGRVPTALQQ
jgi:hypothetical protein